MFKAMIMVCALSSPEECVRFEDTLGPYPTYGECKVRSQEMATGVATMFPVPATYAFKCKELTGT